MKNLKTSPTLCQHQTRFLKTVATICILGAGPSGLTLAHLLEINHIDYEVYERNESADVGGCLSIRKGNVSASH